MISRSFYLSLLKWLVLSVLIGIMAGSASAIFLYSLDWATTARMNYPWLLYFLPIAGLIVALLYHYLGKDVEAGNNQIMTEVHTPQDIIKLRMAPFVLFGTIVTHLFGGSAGREGTAIQMGASLADQLSFLGFHIRKERKLLLIAGMAAGFGSVFGTPLAGAVFGLEVFVIGKLSYEAILPALLSSVIADQVTTRWWGITHSSYSLGVFPDISFQSILYACAAGIIFGLASRLFSWSMEKWKQLLSQTVTYRPLHAVIGGCLIVILTELSGTTIYNGLGLETIALAFTDQLPIYAFALKILFTAITLGAGYKGGEVTCLFFIGAALGNTLSLFIPLPMALLAGMGFVAVFAGASNTPLACTIMAIELFGGGAEIYFGLACVVAYVFSGHGSIYAAQIVGTAKHHHLLSHQGKNISQIRKKLN